MLGDFDNLDDWFVPEGTFFKPRKYLTDEEKREANRRRIRRWKRLHRQKANKAERDGGEHE